MVTTANFPTAVGFQLNTAPASFDAGRDLVPGLYDFLHTLHQEFTPRQQELVAKRKKVLAASLEGRRPDHLRPSEATQGDWKIELPEWCADQRNQMTGPADEAELVVKMLNSGAPGRDARSRRLHRQPVGPRAARHAERAEGAARRADATSTRSATRKSRSMTARR